MTHSTYTNNATPNLSPQSQLNEKVAQLITLPTYSDRAVPGKSGNSAHPILVRDVTIAYGRYTGDTVDSSKIGMWANDGTNAYYSADIALGATTSGIPSNKTGTVTRPCYGSTQYWIGFTAPSSAYMTWAVQNNIESPYVARVREDNTSSTGSFNNDDYAIGSSSTTNGQLAYSVTYDIIPTAPLSLSATLNGTTQIDLSWSAPSNNGGTAITGYKIQRSIDGANFSSIVVNSGSTSTTYSDVGLTPGVTYYYRVAAHNAVTEAFDASYTSPFSNTDSETTSGSAGNTTSTLQIDVSNPAPEFTVFGDYAGAIHFSNLEITYGSERLFNRVVVTREEGSAQTAEAEQSQANYGIRSLDLGSLNETDAEALELAQEYLYRYYEPQLRIEAIQVNINGITTSQAQTVLGLDLDNAVEVYFTPNGIGDPINQIGRIIGISHEIGLESHIVTLSLSTEGLDIFTLDSEVSGILDQNLLG